MKRVVPYLFFLCYCIGSVYGQQLQPNKKSTPQSAFSPYDGAVRWQANKESLPGNLKAFVTNQGEYINTVNNWKVLYGCDYQGTRFLFTDKGVIYIIPESVKLPDENKSKDKEEQEKVNRKTVYHNVAVEWENASSALSVEP